MSRRPESRPAATLDEPIRVRSWRNGRITLKFGPDPAAWYTIVPSRRYGWVVYQTLTLEEMGRFATQAGAEKAAKEAEVRRLCSQSI